MILNYQACCVVSVLIHSHEVVEKSTLFWAKEFSMHSFKNNMVNGILVSTSKENLIRIFSQTFINSIRDLYFAYLWWVPKRKPHVIMASNFCSCTDIYFRFLHISCTNSS